MQQPMEQEFAGTGSTSEARERYLSSLGSDLGEFVLGETTTRILKEDPRNLLFTLARYKFVAKVFSGYSTVLEIGCHEGWGVPLVAQEVGSVLAIDFYKKSIDSCQRRISDPRLTFEARDILDGPIARDFDGVFALDVLEHIDAASDDTFMKSVVGSLASHGTAIVGMPTRESQAYASPASLAGHVNCKTGEELRDLMRRYFQFTSVFSMNDEVVHTGYFRMSQYVFGVGSIPR